MNYSILTKADFNNHTHPIYTIIRRRLYMSKSEFEEHIGNCASKADELGEDVLSCFQRELSIIKPEIPIYIEEIRPANGNSYFKVNPNKLEKYIRFNENLIFVKSEMSNGFMIYHYKNGCYHEILKEQLQGKIKQQIENFDEKLVTSKVIKEVEYLLSSNFKFFDIGKLNNEEKHINFKNGLLDLTSMKLVSHTPVIISTMQIDCDWTDKPITTPIFDNFLQEFSSGDRKVQKFILQYMGACLSNYNGFRYKKSLFMVGQGNSGKSQLKKLCEMILGNNLCSGVDLNALEDRFGTSNLFCKRLVGSSDMSFLSIKELSIFKQITGGDQISIEFKGKTSFNYIFKGLLWFCMNKLPKFGGDRGDWVYDRIIVLPCNNVVSPENQDRTLCDKMYQEKEGIIIKAIKAFKETVDKGFVFDIPDVCKEEMKKYKQENNPVDLFYKECCVERTSKKIEDNCTVKRVYDVFKEWCKDNNAGYCLTKKQFEEELCRLLKVTKDKLIKRTKDNNYYIFSLNYQTKSDFKSIYGYDTI